MIGTVVRSGDRVGVVIAARPVAQPQRVKVAWQPLERGIVTDHQWPPTTAHIVHVLDTKISGRTRRASQPSQDEPVGFSAWCGLHVREAERYGVQVSVPGAGTSVRATLAAAFAALVAEGYSAEDFAAASVGVLSDPYMREHGYVAHDNVLRKTKIGRRIDLGRAEMAKRDAAGPGTDWSAFDG